MTSITPPKTQTHFVSSNRRATAALIGLLLVLVMLVGVDRDLRWTRAAMKDNTGINSHSSSLDLKTTDNKGKKRNKQLPIFHLVVSKVDSSPKEDPISTLNMRCIESIFYFHPNATLHIHTNQETGLQSGLNHHKLQAMVNRGYDLQVIYYTPQKVLQQAIEAPGNSEIDPIAATAFLNRIDSQLKHEKYWYANEANLMRLCILYLQGGIYLDTDVVLINDRFAQDPRINQHMGRHKDGKKFHNAVMKFTQPHNRFLAAVINTMIQHYNGTKWGNNGPKAFGRTAQSYPDWVCPEDRYDYIHHNNNHRRESTEDISWENGTNQDQEKYCYLTPLPNDAVAPLSYKEWDEACFQEDSPSYQKSKHRLDHSFLVHFNNKKTGKQMGSKAYRKGSLCDHVLSSYCILCEE